VARNRRANGTIALSQDCLFSAVAACAAVPTAGGAIKEAEWKANKAAIQASGQMKKHS